MPQASQPQNQINSYGRQIPESQPEEIRPETVQGQQRQPAEERGHRRQILGRQEKITRLFRRLS